MPDTLLQQATENLVAEQNGLTAARAALAAATQQNTAATARMAELLRVLGTVNDRIRDIRRQLGEAATPADADALVELLEDALIERNETAAAIAAAEAALAAAGAAERRAAAEVGRAETGVAQSTALIDRLQPEHDRRQQRLARAQEWTVSPTLEEQANALKASAAFTNAEAKVNAQVPEKLRIAGRARADAALVQMRGRETAARTAEDQMAARLEATGGSEGKVAARRITFERSQRRLEWVAEQAGPELELVRQTFLRIAASNLSAAAQERIETTGTAGDLALTNLPTFTAQLAAAQTLVDDKQAEIEAKQEEIDAAVAASAPAAEIQDLRDELADLQAELDALVTDRDAKQTALEEARTSLDAWEAAVPDLAWENLAAFDDARRALDQLATAGEATAIRTAAINAEKALAEALATAAVDARQRASVAEDVTQTAAAVAADRAARGVRILAELRGDLA